MTPAIGTPSDLMIYVPPYVAALTLAGSAIDLSSLLDLVAVAILLAGVFVVARYRGALAAADASAHAWHEERDAAIARAERITEDLTRERAENAALKSRPDLAELTDLVRKQSVSMDHMADRIVTAIVNQGSPRTPEGG